MRRKSNQCRRIWPSKKQKFIFYRPNFNGKLFNQLLNKKNIIYFKYELLLSKNIFKLEKRC